MQHLQSEYSHSYKEYARSASEQERNMVSIRGQENNIWTLRYIVCSEPSDMTGLVGFPRSSRELKNAEKSQSRGFHHCLVIILESNGQIQMFPENKLKKNIWGTTRTSCIKNAFPGVTEAVNIKTVVILHTMTCLHSYIFSTLMVHWSSYHCSC